MRPVFLLFIPLTISDRFVVLLVRAIATFSLIVRPRLPVPRNFSQVKESSDEWRVATRQTRTKFLRTSKLKQTPRFSVRYRHCSRSVFFPHTLASHEFVGCPSIHRRRFSITLEETTEVAQAEYINCILRACGCNDSVNQDEAVDYDGIIDTLDNFKEALNRCRRLCSPPSSQDDSRLCIPHSHSVRALA